MEMATMFQFKESDVALIRDYPHLLGHLCGKDKLTKLHDTWIKYIWDTNESRSLQAHRGSYKTTSIVAVGAIRWLLFHPDERISLFRKPYTEAANVLGVVKNLMKLDQVKALFKFVHGFEPKLVVKKEHKLVFNFKTTETPEGNLNAYGLDGSYTGTHCDKALIDDAITVKDRISKAERETTKEQIREIQTNVIDRGKPCSFIGTPWHRDDAWTIVPKPLVYPVSDTGLISDDELKVIRSKTTSSLFDCNYNLLHTNTSDAVFSDPVYEPWQRGLKTRTVGHIDAKWEGDCTNGLTFMQQRLDGKIQAVGFTFGEDVTTKIDFIVSKAKYFMNKDFYAEKNADKGYTINLLKDKDIGLMHGYPETTNKAIKIISFLKFYWKEIIWSPETDPEYMNQILDWREGEKPDDCPDSAASLLREAFYKGKDMGLYQM